MIQKFNQYNESIRDEMKPKSKEDVLATIGDMSNVKYKPTKEVNLNNSSGIDTVDVSYDKLVELFGKPDHPDWSWKTNFQWLLEDENGNFLRIYDWKALEHDMDDEDVKNSDSFKWMIGGFDKKDAKKLKNYILYNTLNESLRDQMKAKSEQEIKKSMGKMNPDDKIRKGIEHNIPWLVEDALDDLKNDFQFNFIIDTYLKWAATKGDIDIEIIKMLLEYGADPFEVSYKKVELENRGPKGKEIVELLKQQAKKLYDKQMSESISHNQKEYYNTHGQFAPYSEIKELEEDERGNYPEGTFDEWAKKYNINDNDLCIWVTKKLRDAYMYLLPASMWNDLWEMSDEEAEELIKEEGYTKDDVNVINADGFIIEESDDGDGGFIFVHRK